jgi:hypothetical protein
VLDLSKIEAGHMRLEREPVGAGRRPVGSVEDLLAAGAREKCLEFTVGDRGRGARALRDRSRCA